jgi:hypothetical protein
MTATTDPIAKLTSSFDFFQATDSVFTTNNDGLAACILAAQEVAPALQQELDAQKQNLIALTGICSAYVRRMAERRQDPDAVHDADLWQQVFVHLPLMSPCQLTRQSYDRSIRGTDIAGSFLDTIMDLTVGGGTALTRFARFVQVLGEQVRTGLGRTRTFHTTIIAVVLRTQTAGSTTLLVPSLRAYFIDFAPDQTTMVASCASDQSVHMQFEYRFLETLFDYEALHNKSVADQFAQFLRTTQTDDIQNAQNFFGDTFPGK